MGRRDIGDVADQIVGSGFSSIELRNKAFAQDKQDEFEVLQKRKRNNKTASRTAQRQAMNEQLRALNLALEKPEKFKAGHTK